MTRTSQTTQQNTKVAHLSVLGAGSWGTIIAVLLANNGHHVHLWTRHKDQASAINTHHHNPRYVSHLKLPENIHATSDLTDATNNKDATFMVIPSSGLRDVLTQLPPCNNLISCSKGIEIGSFKRFTQIMHEYQPDAHVAALSGPNLASEIAQGKPTAATIASQHPHLSQQVQHWLNQSRFRIYTSPDLTGVETAGALKNIIALAAGMCDGLELGDNAKATIITRGLAEMIRLGEHLGANTNTFYGLAGLGDIIATCASNKSRNHTAGVQIVQGVSREHIMRTLTAEGIPTVKAVHDYAQTHELELPIASEVFRVVYEGKLPRDAMFDLMRREMKAEH